MSRTKKRKPIPPFTLYTQALSEAECRQLSDFMADLDRHCKLSSGQSAALRADFEKALIYYASLGLPMETALSRLNIKKLGGFYARPPILWYALDDAAKIYPLSMKHGQMAVFRLSAYLDAPVVPELLQMALTFTIKRFPSFATTVKKGFFWHYLDTARRRFAVGPDTGAVCRPLTVSRSGSQSFRVLYYENRISVEFFHILTDGTGGMCFLKTLTAEYLRLTGVDFAVSDGVLDIDDTPSAGETANEFPRADRAVKRSGFIDKPAVQMSGRLSSVKPCQVLHFKMDAGALSSAARSRNATVTAYILAQMFLAQRFATDELQGEISIQVPVNMRKYYPSDTLRNFSLYCGVRLPVSEARSVEDILPGIARQLAEKGSAAAMSEMMSSTESLASALRFLPLFIKAPAARLVYGFLGDKIFSNTLSNLGVVKMPPELSGHIKSMDFVLGTAITNRAGCSMVTFGDTAVLSISKNTADPSFEERLYELLSRDGLAVTVEGSECHEGN